MSKKDHKITTEIKRKKKPHDKFRLKMELDSTPVEVNIEADSTKAEVKKLTANPYKYSFGKVYFPHGVVEACIYIDKNNPQKMPNSILWYFKKDLFAKGKGLVCGKREIKAFDNLIMKTYYFLSLTTERRLKYLRNKGFFANIDSRKDKND